MTINRIELTKTDMYPFNSPIAKKLIWWFVAISTIVALFSTGLQLYLDYRHEVNNIQSYLSSLDETYLPSIAKNTWIMDDNQVTTLLEGITNRDDIIYAAVIVDGTIRWSSGNKTDIDQFQTQLPIYYTSRNRVENIGTLTVIANLERVYQQLTRRIMIVLLSNTIKTFIVAALGLAVVQYLVTRHLQTMSSHVSKINLDEPPLPINLDRKSGLPPDELDTVARTLFSMQRRGYAAYRDMLKGERQLRLFLNSTEEGVFGIDADGVVLFANIKCVQLLNLQAEEHIIGKRYTAILDYHCLTKPHQITGHELLKTILEGKTFCCEDSYVNCCNNNGFYADIRAYPTFSDETCSGAVVFFSDTSDKRALRHQAELLKQALDNSPISVLITDNKLTIVYVNPGFEKGTGYRLNDLVGKKVHYLSEQDSFKMAYQAASEQTLNGLPWQGRIHYRNKIGTNRVIDVVASPIVDDLGKITNLVAVSRDVTYEEEFHNQLVTAQKQKALGRLSASIAHEFGNPLLGIKSLLKDFHERSLLPPEDNHLLEIAIDECGRLQTLIGDIHNFYGAEHSERTLCDTRDIVSKVLFMHQKTFLDNNITPTITHDKNLPQILGKEDQLAQVILNLVNNSVDAMKPGGGSLTITSTGDQDFLHIAVTDSGSGIDEYAKDHLFEPFFSTKPEVEGTGLGLSVSYGIISAHGGKITFTSNEDEGTTFTVHLPVRTNRIS